MEFFENWPYLAWAAGAATTIFLATTFATSFLHPDKKAHLSRWLQGEYESTWAHQFGLMFDRIFGEKHYHFRCILLSAIASGLAVLALWFLFDRILGLITLRTDTGLSLTQVLLLGAAINLIPDYISLYETRWLLKQFERIRNPLGQLAVLVVDAALTGLIIFLGIKAFLWITGAAQISVVEMMALFSIYAIFFYSTFLTSIWAWAYCVSSWLSRMSASLRNWLDVAGSPGRILALFSAGFVFLGTLVVMPVITVDENGETFFDGRLCSIFPNDACKHMFRTSQSTQKKLEVLWRICPKVTAECLTRYEQSAGVTPLEVSKLLLQECLNGNSGHCSHLGRIYEMGIGMEIDLPYAAQLYERGCASGDTSICVILGSMYKEGEAVDQDFVRARTLFKKGCEDGKPAGCLNLGVMYENALGGEQKLEQAGELYQKTCDDGYPTGCNYLGVMLEKASDGAQNSARVRELFQKACKAGEPTGCTNLGLMFEKSEDVNHHLERAVNAYRLGCEGGSAQGCASLGWMYESARGTEQNLQRAEIHYAQACEMKNSWACDKVEFLSTIPK